MKVNGTKITEIREGRGWSREFLAIRAGVTAQAVYSWEGGNVATFTTLAKVAKALNVPEQELLEEE
ncbi:MAG: helix-turn-helix domain-containing protein [Dehalococcoidia bacterium]